jgi:hypothetical protein
MSNVLIVSTAYDRDSALTRRWAERLRGELLNRNIANIFVDGSVLNQTALQDLLSFAECVIFFGHGSRSALISRPSKGLLGQATTLVDNASAGKLFAACPVYAVCCDAREILGPSCPQGFVGYDRAFPIKETAEQEFGEVVVNSAISFVGGDPLAKVAGDTKHMWLSLASDFDKTVAGARFRNHPDAQWGKAAAEALAAGIGKEP